MKFYEIKIKKSRVKFCKDPVKFCKDKKTVTPTGKKEGSENGTPTEKGALEALTNYTGTP